MVKFAKKTDILAASEAANLKVGLAPPRCFRPASVRRSVQEGSHRTGVTDGC